MTATRKPLTDEDRAERRARERELARQAVEQLRASEGWQRWLAVRRAFHAYSFANQILIALQAPAATRVAGFRAWLGIGYCVRKGERAIRIWCPCPPSKRELAEWARRGGALSEKPRTHFRLGAVFDRSQVDELPPPATPSPLDPPIRDVSGDSLRSALVPLGALAREIGSTVDYEPIRGAAHGYYDPVTKRIVIDDALAVNQQVKTLIHELGHALVRAEPGEQPATFDYASEELIVESIAMAVCGTLGLDTSGYSVAYLCSWSEDTPLERVEQAAKLVDRIATRIETAIDAHEPARDGLQATAAD